MLVSEQNKMGDPSALDRLVKKRIEQTTKKVCSIENEKSQELHGLKSFRRFVSKLQVETKEKVSAINEHIVFEKNLEVNSPLETKIGNAFSSPFGLNDSFQKIVHTGPEITPTQMTKSVKDNTSKSFDEVPSFNNPSKSHKSDMQANKPSASTDNKKGASASNRSDLLNNANLSFEEPREKGSRLADVLDDSFGAKQPEDDQHPRPGFHDSFGHQDDLFQNEISRSGNDRFNVLDPLLEVGISTQKTKTNEKQGHATISQTIFSESNRAEKDMQPMNSFQDFSSSGTFLNVQGTHQSQAFADYQANFHSQFSAAQPFAFANTGEFSGNGSEASFPKTFNSQEQSPELRSRQAFGKPAFEPRQMVSIADEGSLNSFRIYYS